MSVSGAPPLANPVHGRNLLMAVTSDRDGGVLAIEYPGGDLTDEQTAAILTLLLRDALGAEPDLGSILRLQKAIQLALDPSKQPA